MMCFEQISIVIYCFIVQVESIDDVKPVQNITLLRNLNLLRNPIQGIANYRLSLLYCIPQLTELDRHRVVAEEKVKTLSTQTC